MDSLQELQRKREELTQQFSLPDIASNPERLKALSLEFGKVQQEIARLEKEGAKTEPGRILMEIRPGTGGEEAALFAGRLLVMYQRFAEKMGWNMLIVDEATRDLGGMKYVTLEVGGKNAYKLLANEGGTHRVQRIPITEKNGRIHTSTVTVAVLPLIENVPIEIKPEDIIFETAKSSGPGGQNVNKRMTAARLTHKPTGLTASSQVERSLDQNRQRAFALLKAKIYAESEEKKTREAMQERKEQVGTGERSEKIRTFNFPQDRVTDHRLQKSWGNIEGILQGNIKDILESCSALS